MKNNFHEIDFNGFFEKIPPYTINIRLNLFERKSTFEKENSKQIYTETVNILKVKLQILYRFNNIFFKSSNRKSCVPFISIHSIWTAFFHFNYLFMMQQFYPTAEWNKSVTKVLNAGESIWYINFPQRQRQWQQPKFTSRKSSNMKHCMYTGLH